MDPQFHSGITLTQARKDAKKLAKSEGLPFHKALDSIAKQHHGLSWNKSVQSLKAMASSLSFRLKGMIDNEQVAFQLTRQEPLCIIDGYPGSGKTIAALSMAEYHLKQGFAVHYFAGFEMPDDASPHLQDLALNLALAFAREYEGFYIHPGRNSSDLQNTDWEEHSLVVIDEAHAFDKDPQFTNALLDLLRSRKCFVIMLSQYIELLRNIDELQKHLACIMFGKRHDASMKRNVSFMKQYLSAYPRVGQYLSRNLLGVFAPDNESRFFFVQKDFADVVRFPLPTRHF
jgi:Rad3-related DNA helicase